MASSRSDALLANAGILVLLGRYRKRLRIPTDRGKDVGGDPLAQEARLVLRQRGLAPCEPVVDGGSPGGRE